MYEIVMNLLTLTQAEPLHYRQQIRKQEEEELQGGRAFLCGRCLLTPRQIRKRSLEERLDEVLPLPLRSKGWRVGLGAMIALPIT